jgi:proteasome lid subunit RPN8/RPN11
MLRLTENHRAAIAAHGEQTYPDECCGFLIGRTEGDIKIVEEVRAATNVHEEGHARRYLVDPREQLQVEKSLRGTGQSVVGYYHSHPNVAAQPSEYDRAHAWPFYSYVIISVRDGRCVELNSFTLSDDGSRMDPEEVGE